MRVKKSHEIAQAQEIPTDRFSSWLRRTRQAQKTNEGASVPCGACTACCTSSYFIHIRPDETDTLAKIPKELLFAAPGLPKGHVVLGYDKNGHFDRVSTLLHQIKLDQVTALVRAIVASFGEIWRCATASEFDAYVARHRNYLEELLLFEVAHEGRATVTMRIVAGLAGLEETLEQWEIRLQQAYSRA